MIQINFMFKDNMTNTLVYPTQKRRQVNFIASCLFSFNEPQKDIKGYLIKILPSALMSLKNM